MMKRRVWSLVRAAREKNLKQDVQRTLAFTDHDAEFCHCQQSGDNVARATSKMEGISPQSANCIHQTRQGNDCLAHLVLKKRLLPLDTSNKTSRTTAHKKTEKVHRDLVLAAAVKYCQLHVSE